MIPKHRVATIGIVTNDQQQILLVKHPYRGWELPGGYVELEEKCQTAIVREVLEESGIEIKIEKLCGVIHNSSKHIFLYIYLGRCIGGSLQKSNETLDSQFFSRDKAMAKIKDRTNREIFERCFNSKDSPFFIEL